MNLADLPPQTRGLPMFDDPRSPLAGERRHDRPRPGAGPLPVPLPLSLPLPGAGNPATLLATIDRHLALARRAGQHLALLAVAIQPRQAADDTAAAAAGDAVAEALATEFGRRLRARVRATDTVLWQGGCDHVLLLQPCRQVGALAARQRLLKALGGPYLLGPLQLDITATIGCASFPAAGETSALLLAAALAARGEGSLPGPR